MRNADIQTIKLMYEQLLVSLLVDELGVTEQSFILLEETGRLLGFDLQDLELEKSEESGRISLVEYPTRYV